MERHEAEAVHRNSVRIRVLVVDDDDYDLRWVRRTLDSVDPGRYDVGLEMDPERVRERLAEGYDVCLIDNSLGAESGLDLIRTLVESGEPTPLVLFTGSASRDLDLAAMEVGAADFVLKDNLTPALLERTLRYAVERRRVRSELTRLAMYDQLTGLPNRALFRDRLSTALLRARRNGNALALMFIDLNGFKGVNDELGHEAGDTLLKQVASRLQGAIREVDAVSRLGGDEFTVILEGIRRHEDIALVGHRLLRDIAHPSYRLGGDRKARLSASIGVAVFPQDGSEPERLQQNADTAMYRAKAHGGGLLFYNDEMTVAVERRRRLQQALQSALVAREFVLHYQPQVELASQQIVGVEALLRWSQDGGLVSPAEFIPALEESGLIIDVGEWVIRQACRDLAQWRARGLTGLHVAVNVSARQFRSPHLTSIIEDALASSGLPGSALEIELTESSVMTDTELSIAALTAIKAHGVRVSVDDFGTGYSSLAYLKKLPVDVLKVDRSFIRDIPHADDGSIANCVIALGSTLGLTVIAEGVETAEQLTFLNNTGCTSYQGYLFSRPLPAEDCFDLLMTQSAPGAQVDTPAPTIVAPKFSTNRVV